MQRYLPTLQALERDYRAKDVQFVAVNAAEEDTLIAMATQAVQQGTQSAQATQARQATMPNISPAVAFRWAALPCAKP